MDRVVRMWRVMNPLISVLNVAVIDIVTDELFHPSIHPLVNEWRCDQTHSLVHLIKPTKQVTHPFIHSFIHAVRQAGSILPPISASTSATFPSLFDRQSLTCSIISTHLQADSDR
mmetsp:Transcript_1329/g.2188  ORF Transcript_1329/g.2188 Transcript_1329/m.2188 type:complete len:115 (+) Transcript_1329:1647-1991(+)